MNLANSTPITTPDEAVAYVNRVDLCTWRYIAKLAWMPSLEMETNWRGMEFIHETWFWKDDLHIDRLLYFGMLLAPDTPVFVSLQMLPILIAAQGDNDARTLFEKGELASNALKVYEHIERSGPTATSALPWPKGSRMLYMTLLQQKFLLTKHALTGRTRGKYGYLWCLAEHAFPEAFEMAARIRVGDAREQVTAHLREHASDLTMERTARLFRWRVNG